MDDGWCGWNDGMDGMDDAFLTAWIVLGGDVTDSWSRSLLRTQNMMWMCYFLGWCSFIHRSLSCCCQVWTVATSNPCSRNYGVLCWPASTFLPRLKAPVVRRGKSPSPRRIISSSKLNVCKTSKGYLVGGSISCNSVCKRQNVLKFASFACSDWATKFRSIHPLAENKSGSPCCNGFCKLIQIA